MGYLSKMSLAGKFKLAILLTTGIALVLTCLVLFVHELLTFRRTLERDLDTTADVLGNASVPAIVYDRREEAGEILSSLHADSQIVSAIIYDGYGQPFASYSRDGAEPEFPARPPEDGSHFEGERLSIAVPIIEERAGERVGTFYLSADFRRIYERMQLYAIVLVSALAGALCLAFLLSHYFQSALLRPIHRLAAASRKVSQQKDYSPRVKSASTDEVGFLVDAFNQMLDEIQQQDAALRGAKDELEENVRQRTRELEQRTRELERSNAELEQFAYVASHDLQEPLRMVASYTQLLQRRYRDKLDQDAIEFMDFAIDGARRMQDLISDLLEYSRVGTRGDRFAQVSTAKILDEVQANLRKLVEETGTEIKAGDLPDIVADERQMVQLFQNLLSNAIKFRGTESPRIFVGAEKTEGEWLFQVQDNGIGIEEEYRERIFVVFQRLHGYSETSGTGIGLAVCKKIVDRHRGRIWVESEPAKGSTFCFTIPLTANQESR